MVDVAQWFFANWETLAMLMAMLTGLRRIFVKVSKLLEAVEHQKEYNSVIMECVLVLLCAAKGEKLNGNVTAALKRLNEFMVKESSNN